MLGKLVNVLLANPSLGVLLLAVVTIVVPIELFVNKLEEIVLKMDE